jgi:hypothetical protein
VIPRPRRSWPAGSCGYPNLRPMPHARQHKHTGAKASGSYNRSSAGILHRMASYATAAVRGPRTACWCMAITICWSRCCGSSSAHQPPRGETKVFPI